MKSMCSLCIQFTHENTSECTILHLVKKKDPLSKVWLLALQKRLAMPLNATFNNISVISWRYLEKTTDLPQVTDKHFNI
jgi:hypothetical protein